MGSGSSSAVRAFEPGETKEDERKYKSEADDGPKSKRTPKQASETVSKLKLQLMDTEDKLKATIKERDDLSKQVGELSSTCLDLEEQVQLLQDQIDNYATTADHRPDYEESLKLKEKSIDKLEKQVQNLSEQLQKSRKLHRKKIKNLNTKLGALQSEQTIERQQLIGEIEQLKEEKANLKTDSVGEGQEAENTASNSWSEVIRNLSVQISDQSDQITQLQNMLHAKEKELAMFKRKDSQNSDARPPSSHFQTLKTESNQSNEYMERWRQSEWGKSQDPHFDWHRSKPSGSGSWWHSSLESHDHMETKTNSAKQDTRTPAERRTDSGISRGSDMGNDDEELGITPQKGKQEDSSFVEKSGAFITELLEEQSGSDSWLSSDDEKGKSKNQSKQKNKKKLQRENSSDTLRMSSAPSPGAKQVSSHTKIGTLTSGLSPSHGLNQMFTDT